MTFEEFLKTNPTILAEGSVYEKLRRCPDLDFDPYLAHATLIYDERGRSVLAQVHREYLDIGQKYRLPMIASAATWRANEAHIRQSDYRDRPVNQDNVRFLADIRAGYGSEGPPIFIAGALGPKGDAYRPQAALTAEEAVAFHTYQAQALSETEVDYLIAATLPAYSEALGLARAMAATGLPYVLSFVLRQSGTLLDGTPFEEAILRIDQALPRPPTGYSVNCIHPSVFQSALRQARNPATITDRLLSFEANTAALSPEELDGSAELITEAADTFGRLMGQVYREFRPTILGGCCGTDSTHIEQVARQLQPSVET